MISATEADWTREKYQRFWVPGRKLLKSIRDYQRYHSNGGVIAKVLSKLCVLRYMFWTVISGADIPLNTNIGGGLLIPHPNGIVIHPDVRVGVNCLIHQQVTIGVKRGNSKAPIIAGHVDIGAGAKIIGNITLGDHVRIGANAVVLKDIPNNCTAVGIPAKVIKN